MVQKQKQLSPEEMVQNADRIVEMILHPVLMGSLDHAAAVQITKLVFEIVKATYPFPERLDHLLQEADTTFAMVIKPSGEPC